MGVCVCVYGYGYGYGYVGMCMCMWVCGYGYGGPDGSVLNMLSMLAKELAPTTAHLAV